MIPVSYTHLDVYKRQLSAKADQVRKEVSLYPVMEIKSRITSVRTPVSYTHLMAHIGRLREKLHEPPRKPKFIKTVWGVGYQIE